MPVDPNAGFPTKHQGKCKGKFWVRVGVNGKKWDQPFYPVSPRFSPGPAWA
jgi:hypothetical protein